MDLRANTAVDVLIGPFVDSTDGDTDETGLTISQADVKLSKNGQALAQKNDATAAAHDADGYYNCELDATDTNTEGNLVLKVHESGALNVRHEYNVMAEAAWDSLYAAKDTGFMDVNVKAIGEDTTAPDNLATLFDGVEGFASAYAGPRGPGVYLNDAAANTNTANGVDGTWSNPVSTIAAAKTIADSLSVDRIYLVNDSAVTLAATMEDYEFVGIGEMAANSINLGTQDVDNSEFWNLVITGAQGGTGRFQATGCVLSVITGMEITALSCLIANAGSLTLRDDCAFDSCFSAVAGAATPTLDINSVANVNVYFRHYSGGLTVDNAVATTVMSYEADGQIIIDATCTSLTIVVRGNCTITDNGTTTSLTQDGAVNLTNVADSVWDEILTGATHNIATSAGRRLRGIQEFQGYENGAVWIDTVNGTAGTTDFENGTVENPVDSIADANTIAASLGLTHFHVASGSSITFAASQTNQVFEGENWTLALGGQSIDGSHISGAAVTGIATNATGDQEFHDCMMGAVTLPGDTHLIDCGLSGTQTMGEAGDYFYDGCHSAVAGTGTVTIDFGAALNASNLNVRHHSGGWTVANMGAGTGTYEATFEGHGQVIWAASCSATSNASIRGHWKITDNASGAVTETLDDTTTNVAQTATAVGTDGTGLTEAGGTGDHLTAINLPNQTMDITGNLSGSVGSVTGAVGSVTGAVGSVAGNVDGNVTGSVGSLAAQAKTDVNTEVLDVMNVDTITLPGQEAPPLAPTHREMDAWLYKLLRNRTNQTATLWQLFADNETTVDAKATVSSDGTTAVRQEIVTGP